MKQLFTLLSFAAVSCTSAQGKFFGGNGDGFATATISNIVLPSTGLTANGASCGEHICLYWSTLQELNTSHFTIERMGSTVNFETIGRVAAAGTSYEKKNYSFIDKWPVQGINYYRLAQTDMDGHLVYSSTIPVEHQSKKLIAQFANPAGDRLLIRVLQSPMPFTLSIYDMQGKLIKRSVHTSLSITEDINSLADGLYLLTIEGKEKKEQRKFIKLRNF